MGNVGCRNLISAAKWCLRECAIVWIVFKLNLAGNKMSCPALRIHIYC